MESLFKPSFPHFYRKRSGERDVSARATHLKAEIGNVSISTTERKQMSTKTNFKRIALVAVAALGLGVLSVAPSSAATTVIDETLTLSAASATVGVGETASVTITNTFIQAVANETSSIVVTGAGAAANANVAGAAITAIKADSVNATFSSGGGATDSMVITSRTGITVGASDTLTVGGGSAGNYVVAKYRLDIRAVTTVGTHTYTIYTKGVQNTVNKAVVFTLTVTAASAASATYSKMYINGISEFAGATTDINLVNTPAALAGLQQDSALVVSAGTTTPAAVGVIWPIVKNGNDTKTSITGTRIQESVTITITGPGLLAASGNSNGVGYVGLSAKSKQVTIAWNETAIVYSDGTPGTGTITSYLGATVSNAATVKFAQAVKTVNFYGKATTFTATRNVYNNISYARADSVATLVTFTAEDSAGNAVTDATLNNTANGTSGFYAISSDTSVIGATLGNDGTLNNKLYSTCSYAAADGYWSCIAHVRDSGTATITIADSLTVATATASSAAVSFTVVGAAYSGTLTFDKATYAPGEKAVVTITAKDRAGRSAADGARTVFTGGVEQNRSWSTSADVTYGSGSTFVAGSDTYVVYMPSTAGDVTLVTKTSYDSSTQFVAVTGKATVVDPNAAAVAAAKDASDAATDAALEATDAAYAATDAANIAAEAADAATAAAEAATEAANAAKESADAATAAVEELATSVAKLMAALQAQITTLAKVVAKIAVKVKA